MRMQLDNRRRSSHPPGPNDNQAFEHLHTRPENRYFILTQQAHEAPLHHHPYPHVSLYSGQATAARNGPRSSNTTSAHALQKSLSCVMGDEGWMGYM